MFRLTATLALLSLTTISYAQYRCESASADDENYQKCHMLNQSETQALRQSSPCPQPYQEQGNDSNILQSAGATVDTPLSCEDQDIFGEMNSKDKPSKDQVVKEYSKQCKKKAKAYKRAVFKKLMKQFKLGQAFQALVKKKKNIASSSYKKGKKENVTIDSNPKDFEGMSQDELNDYILSKLNEKVPGLKNALDSVDANKDGLSKGFHESETIPLNIVVEPKGKNACIVSLESAPKKEQFTPEACPFCKGSDMKKSFVDDCSYMKSANYSEEDALKLMGANSNKKEDYCQPNMASQNSDMGEIDALASKLCKIAEKGMSPDFDIETTRNLYNDKTDDLAAKRGLFIQNYLRDKVQKDCELAEAPEWLSDKKLFAEKIRVSHPQYEGRDKVGDYGPDPYATAEKQEQEISNYKTTMKNEKEQLIAKKEELSKKAQDKGEKANVLKTEAEALATQYETLKKELEETKDIGKMNQIYGAISTLSNTMNDIHNSIDNLEQESYDLKQQVIGFNTRIEKYSSEGIESKASLLKQYYDEKNANPNIDKKEWDKKLFNEFKMVRISGRAVEDHGLPSIDDGISPKLSMAINAMVRLDQFTCTMDPISTKKSKLSGKMKVLGKVGLAIASPVVLAVGTAATVAMAPVTTTATLFCDGCHKPGKKMPRWMMIGNPFALDLKKGWPKRMKKDIKSGVETYFDLGGALKIRKTDQKVTVHKFEDFN